MEPRLIGGIAILMLGACASGEELDNKSRSDFENLTRPPYNLIHPGPELAPEMSPEERNQMEREMRSSIRNALKQ